MIRINFNGEMPMFYFFIFVNPTKPTIYSTQIPIRCLPSPLTSRWAPTGGRLGDGSLDTSSVQTLVGQ